MQLAEGAIDKAVQILLEDTSASVVLAEFDRSSEVYSALLIQLGGPVSAENLVQEISKVDTFSDKDLDTLTSVAGAPSFQQAAAILTHTDAQIDSSEHLNITVLLTYSWKPGEDANGCNAQC